MVTLILLVLGALVLLSLLCAARQAIKRHGSHRLAWRWLSGHHLDGQHRTNAGWLEHGTKALTPNGRASRWAHKPRLERAFWRTGSTVFALAAAYGLITDTGPVLIALATLAVLGLTWASWRGWRGTQQWQHTRRWVRPLHLTLAPLLGHPLAIRPKAWLEVPRDYAGREGAQITVKLPEGFAATGDVPKQAITAIVCAKLALEQPSASWHLAGHNPHVVYRVQVPPPDKVTLAGVREAIAAAKDTAPVLGLGRGRRVVSCDLDQDSPHILLSMGSGAGKSVAARGITAQVLNRGGLALILDVKRLSHAWARTLPSVRYARSAEEIHNALLWLSAELERRNTLADENATIDGDVDPEIVGPRIIVICEELNATIQRLGTYWRSIRSKEDSTVSPAVDALGEASFMGRAVKVNLLLIGQMITARAVGGPEIRESAGTRLLGRYTQNAARMLVPEVYPFPKSSRKPGRIQAYVGGSLHETQLALMTPAEARELSTSGTVSQFPGMHAADAPADLAGKLPANVTRLRLTPEPIGLRQAVADGIVPGSLEAVRSARARDPEFPPSRGTGPDGGLLYDPDELGAWARNRPRAAGE
jgi:hypothetical protein